MSLPMDNPLAAVPTDDLERQYEQQNAGLAEAIRAGNLERARQIDEALNATSSELKSRGVNLDSNDRVKA